MNMRLLPILASGLLTLPVGAQVYITTQESLPNLTSVTNEGRSVGANDQNCPFFIWNPIDDTYTLIGGISSGQGIGGQAKFSGNGLTLVAPAPDEEIPYNTEWVSAMMPDFASYTINGIVRFAGNNLYAYGANADGSAGIILKSPNNGLTWRGDEILVKPGEDGSWLNILPDFEVRFVGPITNYCILAGGEGGTLYVSNGNGLWNPVTPDGLTLSQSVKTYTAIGMLYEADSTYDFLAADCCIGVELEDGTGAIFYSNDGTDTFAVAEGVEGVPLSITTQGDRFLMTTSEHCIQVSDDYGKTWRTVFTDNIGRDLRRIVMNDVEAGVVVTDNIVYMTTDGGLTWEEKSVFGSFGVGFPPTCDWQDAAWDGETLTIVGTEGKVYYTTDMGETFTKQPGFAGKLTSIFYDDLGSYCVMGSDGVLYTKKNIPTYSGYLASLYDVESGTWTSLPATGYPSDISASSPWGFSGDGKHAVGLSHGYETSTATATTQAAVWDGTESILLLPNRFLDRKRACRANAVSYDGSVIVGWQDIWGPWYASVWRRGDDGKYTQTMLTLDPNVNIEDIDVDDKDQTMSNFPGFAQCVTDDGKWIGGNGNATTAPKGPWIWSEETGIIEIDQTSGCVADIRNDGTMAIGWQGSGQGAWIWDTEKGVRPLQDYLEQELGYDMKGLTIVSCYDLSPNGRYICGYGIQNDIARGYVVDLMYRTDGVERLQEQIKASVYPNPVADELHVDLPFDFSEASATLTLINMQGQTVRRVDAPTRSNVIDVRGLTPGVYMLTASNEAGCKTVRVIVK